MKDSTRVAAVLGVVVALFLVVQLGALALVEPFKDAGLQSTENPQNPLNSIVYVAFLLVATGGILLVIKYDVQWLLRGFVLLTSGLISSYVFGAILPTTVVGGVNAAAWLPAAVLVVALYAYPEWYVIDGAGAIMGMGAAALFGISFGVLPAIVLLGALAVYDAISVYGTEHMLTLASGVMELRLPIVLVVPSTLDYSFREQGGETAAEASEGEREGETPVDRPAYFIGLGDAVMPSIMVASAAFFLDTPQVFGVELAALTAMVGTLVGLLALMRLVFEGRAHAGLPLLNGGAILGYLLGALAAGVSLVEALGVSPYV
ncbi:MAG: presenilin family intramembrane aspartyl protease PSH [Halobacterium sp.]